MLSFTPIVGTFALFCLLLGFSLWWALAPEQLLAKPAALCSPDLSLIVRVVKDTYLNHICSTHQVSLPCECGAPLNKTARLLFSPDESFDPPYLVKLGQHPCRLVRPLSIFVASIILSLALAESVSVNGYLSDGFWTL